MEDDGDGFSVGVRDFFDVYLFLFQGLYSDVSVGCIQGMEYCWEYSSEYACVWVDDVCEVLVVDCCVDFLDDGAFDKVSEVEFLHILIVLADGVLNLILCCIVYLRRGYWMHFGAIKYCCRVDAGVGSCGCDESKVALVTSPEAAWDGSTIGADLFL